MSCSKPVLALVDENSELEKVINENKLGVAIEHGDAIRLAKAITTCYENKEELEKWGKNAREFAVNNFSRKVQTKKYYDIIEYLANSKRVK